nr:hypothetical protein [Tanacetum cinerariifolium]
MMHARKLMATICTSAMQEFISLIDIFIYRKNFYHPSTDLAIAMESFSNTVISFSSTQVKIESNDQTLRTNGDPWNNTEASSDRVAPEDYVAIDIKEDKVETPPA